MHPPSLLALLLTLTTTSLLIPLATATPSFALRTDKHWYGHSCSLVIADTCGCSKTVSVNK
ncbi:MAG: hypothetical protein HETSPECPRED_002890, partial [Heterodermia speciosa]